MMAVILNSTMLDSDTLFSSLRFTQKHSHSTLILTQTNSIWLKLIHSDSTWWWQPSWILPCWIQTPCFLLSDSLKNMLPPLWLWLKLIQSDSKLIHSHSTWWWQPSWIWPSWIQLPYFFLSNSLTLARIGSHHLHKKDYTHISLPTICTKNTSLIHSDSTWWRQPSWILPCWIKNFTHSYWLNLMMAAILNSAMLDSDTLFSFPNFTQKHSHSTLTLTQTSLIWLKLIHSDSTWWWQPSWILPSWIWPSWIQPP